MENKIKNKSLILKSISAVLRPTFAAMFYVSLVLAAILTIVCLIIVFVNVPVEEMLLPPFMKSVIEDGELTSYIIYLGNGIKINADADTVTLQNIKTALYCGIAIAIAALLVLAPIMRFVSRLLKNVLSGKLFDYSNAKYINYTGITILIGNTAVLFVSRFFNYYLVKTFVADGTNVAFSAGIDLMGIIMGMFVLLLGNIYGYACKIASPANENHSIEKIPEEK